MSERLTAAFAAIADRGTVAGAGAVWQRALLAAAVDERPQRVVLAEDSGPFGRESSAGSGLAAGDATPLVPVVRPGAPASPAWIEVRAGDPFGKPHGRRRVGLAVGLSAAALLGVGLSAAVLRDGDGGPEGLPGAPGGVDATTAVPSLPDATTAIENTETTFGGGQVDPIAPEYAPTTFGGGPGDTAAAATVPGFGYAVSPPCVLDDAADEPSVTSTTAPDSTEYPPTTPGGSVGGYGGPVCVYADGTLPPVTDGPGSDWVSAPTTLPADAGLAYWRMLDDLDITWRAESDGTYLYWRTPAGQGGAPDEIGGAAVLLVPATDRYIVLARAGTTDSGAPGQRPLQIRATLADGSAAVASITYDNAFGLGYAYLDTTLTVIQITAV